MTITGFRAIPALFCACLLVACNATQREAMPPDEAKKTKVIFRSIQENSPPRTIRDITQMLDQYAPEAKHAAELRARMEQPIPESADHYTEAMAYWDRARAAQELGAVSRQIADLRRAQELGSASDPERVLNELSTAEWLGGNYMNAIRGFEQLRQTGSAGYQTSSASIEARCYSALGDMELAHEMLNSAKTSLNLARHGNKKEMWIPNWETQLDFAQGMVLNAEGQLLPAEMSLREAMRQNEESVRIARKVNGRIANYPAAESLETRGDNIESHLAINQLHQGHLNEAELSARNVLKHTLSRNGKYSLNTGMAVSSFSLILFAEGRYREAEVMANAAIDILLQAGVTPDSLALARARRIRGAILVSLARYADAAAEYERAEAGVTGRLNIDEEAPWAIALIRIGKAQAAVDLLKPMIAKSTQQLGETHYQTALLRGYLGMAEARLGRPKEAMEDFMASAKILLAKHRGDADEQNGSPARAQHRTWIIEAYIGLLADLHSAGNDQFAGFDVVEESMRLSDIARGGNVQRAVAASAARAAMRDVRMADQVRKEQDLKAQIAAQYKILLDLLTVPLDQQSPSAITELRGNIAKLSEERKKLQDDIEQRFPNFANLITPKAPNAEETRAALEDSEALLSILVTEDRSFVWAMTKEKPIAFTSVALGEKEINALVSRLRQSVDPGQVQLGALPEFDLTAAYQLYSKLLLPVESSWGGARTLLVSTNGSLGQLPLATLPTRPVKLQPDSHLLFAEYREVPWLAKQIAVVQIPSVNSLVLLRALPPGNPKRQAFYGFGDPQFDRSGTTHVAAVNRGKGPQLRSLAISRLTQAAAVSPGINDDWMDYAQIPPLPDTRDEILAIAQALGADTRQDVFLGSAASKKNVFSLPLDQRRILAFSTHGLIPGDFPGLSEPALAMAAPDNPNESGLLTLDDILGLKLDADWIVLSACNTAAGEGSGAEAVSGLGRGFFYAGSRALLVTHWPVETVSARLLVTGTFERYSTGSGMTRAESLRQSMLKLMAGEYVDPISKKVVFAYAHPIFWAPYALVGDGGGALKK